MSSFSKGTRSHLEGYIEIPLAGYDAVVYQSGGKTIARDRNGFMIDSGASGQNNDKRVIQAASLWVSQNGGGKVFVASGSYSVMQLLMYSNASLKGQGIGNTIFVGYNDNSNKAVIEYNGQYNSGSPLVEWSVEDIEIDGTNMNPSGYNVGRKGINVQYYGKCSFKNIYIHNCPATGFGLDYPQDVTLDNVYTVNNGTPNQTSGSNGIGIGTGGFTRERCVIKNCISLGNTDNNLIFEAQGGTGVGEYLVTNFISEGAGNGGIVNNGTYGVQFNHVSDNASVYGCQFSSMGTPTQYAIDCKVSNSKFTNNTTYGIYIADEHCDNITIVGNTVRYAGQHGIYLKGTNITCDENNVTDCGQNGIYSFASTVLRKNYHIHNNQCLRNSTAAGNTYHGIKMDASSIGITNLSIQGNNCSDDSGVPKQKYGIVLVAGAGNIQHATVLNNQTEGNVTGGYIMTGSILDVRAQFNQGYNPVGVIANCLDTTNNLITAFGSTGTPVQSTDYVISGQNILLTSTGGTGVSITIKDAAGNTIDSGLATLTRQPLFIGYKVNFGAFGGAGNAPTLKVAFD